MTYFPYLPIFFNCLNIGQILACERLDKRKKGKKPRLTLEILNKLMMYFIQNKNEKVF